MKWNEFIGQTEIKEELETILASSMPIPHILFYGGWGVGKTTLAKLFADRIGFCCYNVATQKQLEFPDWASIYIIDEIHALSRPEKLYPLMEEKLIIGCTTKIGSMDLPLRSRFVEFTFRDYTEDELKEVIQVAMKHYCELNDLTLNEIAKRSRGIPRSAINLAFRLVRFSEVNNIKTCPEMIDRVCTYYGIDENGLTIQDEKYLNVLKTLNRPVGLRTLSGMTGLDVNTITLVVEPFLMKKGLVSITTGGRIYNA